MMDGSGFDGGASTTRFRCSDAQHDNAAPDTPAPITHSISQVAHIAGTTVKTLRVYDERGLLVPARTASGYRAYTDADLDRPQLILLYRMNGLSLGAISTLLHDPDASAADQLRAQLSLLRK